MKKVLLVVSILCVAIAVIVVSCQKSGKNEQKDENKQNPSAEISSRAFGGSACQCGVAQISCQSNCWLSDCCVCWNPLTSDGGCGCWLGVALCRVESKKRDPGVAPSRVKVYEARMLELFEYMDKISVKTAGLRNRYKTVSEKSALYGKERASDNFRMLPGTDYTSFAQFYTEFTKGLRPDDQNKISDFIELKKTGLVK